MVSYWAVLFRGKLLRLTKLFFPSLLAGPAFDFVEYRQWIDTTMFEISTDTDAKHYRKIPPSGRPALVKFCVGACWLLAYLKLSPRYSPAVILEGSDQKTGFLHKLWILHMLGFSTRMKYYSVWTLTEGACILSGMGFNGVDPTTGRIKWDRLQNVNPWGVETAQNTREYLENWNKNTNRWLRNYVYLRIMPPGRKPGFRATIATFLTSAFWHGFEPGYYMTFVLAAALQAIAKSRLFNFVFVRRLTS